MYIYIYIYIYFFFFFFFFFFFLKGCKHPKTREKFYKDIKGIILVHDLSNNKSYKNLWKWLKEIIHSETFKSSGFYERVKTG